MYKHITLALKRAPEILASKSAITSKGFWRNMRVRAPQHALCSSRDDAAQKRREIKFSVKRFNIDYSWFSALSGETLYCSPLLFH